MDWNTFWELVKSFSGMVEAIIILWLITTRASQKDVEQLEEKVRDLLFWRSCDEPKIDKLREGEYDHVGRERLNYCLQMVQNETNEKIAELRLEMEKRLPKGPP